MGNAGVVQLALNVLKPARTCVYVLPLNVCVPLVLSVTGVTRFTGYTVLLMVTLCMFRVPEVASTPPLATF